MIQRIAAITSVLGVATIAINSIVDFLNAIEKHRTRNPSSEYQKQHYSGQNGRTGLSMKAIDSTNIGRTEGSFPRKTGHCRICDHKGYTEWHHIIVWNKLADFATGYLDKGHLVYIEGSIRTRSWNDKNKESKKITEILATHLVSLEKTKM